MLSSQEPAALDALIDRAQGTSIGGGLSLHAVKIFGGSRHHYVDIDCVGMLKSMLALMPAEATMAGLLGALKPGEPMTFAVTQRDGRMLAQSRVPLDPFIQIVKFAQAGQRSPAPPPEEQK
jgi:hypothetical protein